MTFLELLPDAVLAMAGQVAAQVAEEPAPPGATWADGDAILMLALGLVAVGTYLARR